MTLAIHQFFPSQGTVILLYFSIGFTSSSSSMNKSPITTISPQAWNLHGKPGDGYYTQAEIGTPPQKFSLLVDTGSSNLAIASAPHKGLDAYFVTENSSTFINLGTSVNVVYTQGSWSGFLGKDHVYFPMLLGTVDMETDLSLITSSDNFYVNNSHWQGIVGLGFSALAQPHGRIMPWFDGLVEKTKIKNSFTFELCGPYKENGISRHSGSLYIGSSMGLCPLASITTPILRPWFYEVLVVEMAVGNKLLNIPCVHYNTDKSIVDSGTSNLRLPSQVFRVLIAELKAQTRELDPPLSSDFWMGKEEVCWPDNQQAWDAFPSITVHLAHSNKSAFTITIPPQSYLRPAPDAVYKTTDCWILGIDESQTGTVLGAVVLEGLCVTFDRGRGVIGFSESSCGPLVILGEVYNSSEWSACVYVPNNIDGLKIASYVMGALLGLISLSLVFAAFRWMWQSLLSHRPSPDVPFMALDENNT